MNKKASQLLKTPTHPTTNQLLLQPLSFAENHINTSAVIQEYYALPGLNIQRQTHPETQGLVDQLTCYINVKNKKNKLLYLEGDTNHGRLELITQFLAMHQRKKPQDVCIIRYANLNHNTFSSVLYEILTTLRFKLDISQKVEMQEQKLRKYFPYWLNICAEALIKKAVAEGYEPVNQIVIVIQDIDHIVNSKRQQVLPEFWLPQFLPEKIKLILTGSPNTECSREIRAKQVMEIVQITPKIVKELIDHSFADTVSLAQSYKKKSDKSGESSYSMLKMSQKYLKNTGLSKQEKQFLAKECFAFDSQEPVKQLYLKIAQIAQKTKKIAQKDIHALLKCLILTKNGLTTQELSDICSLSHQHTEDALEILEPMVYFHCSASKTERLYMVCEKTLHNLFDFTDEELTFMHTKIGSVVAKQPNCIRKLQEQMHHLLMSSQMKELKETICDIENFLLLFNPYTKIQLCLCWQALELKYSLDPVVEYNRALEFFETHYRPTHGDLFKMLLQLSRFFMEYADFETFKTPDFKHPLIKDEKENLQNLCLYDTFKNYKLLEHASEANSSTETQETPFVKKQTDEQSRKSVKVSTKHDKKLVKNPNQSKTSPLDGSQVASKEGIVQKLAKLKLELPGNRTKFKSVFDELLQDFYDSRRYVRITQAQNPAYLSINKPDNLSTLTKNIAGNHSNITTSLRPRTLIDKATTVIVPHSKISEVQMQYDSCDETQYPQESTEEPTLETENQEEEALKQYIEQLHNDSEYELKRYCMKQWLWAQFPWISLCIDFSFSDLIKNYYETTTSYLTVEEELQFAKQALEIAVQAKRRKANLYKSGDESNVELCLMNEKFEQARYKFRKNKNRISTRINGITVLGSTNEDNGDEGSTRPRPKRIRINVLEELHNYAKTNRASHKIQNENRLTHNKSEKAIHFGRGFLTEIDAGHDEVNSKQNGDEFLFPKIQQKHLKEKSIATLKRMKSLSPEQKLISIRSEYDRNIDECARLEKKYNQLKLKEQALASKEFSEKEDTLLVAQIEAAVQRLEEMENKYSRSLLQEMRIRQILDACTINKVVYSTHIEPLEQYVSNIKSMIEYLGQECKVLKKDTAKRLAKYKKKFQGDVEEFRMTKFVNNQLLNPLNKNQAQKQKAKSQANYSQATSRDPSRENSATKKETDLSRVKPKTQARQSRKQSDQNNKHIKSEHSASQNQSDKMKIIKAKEIFGQKYESLDTFLKEYQEQEELLARRCELESEKERLTAELKKLQEQQQQHIKYSLDPAINGKTDLGATSEEEEQEDNAELKKDIKSLEQKVQKTMQLRSRLELFLNKLPKLPAC